MKKAITVILVIVIIFLIVQIVFFSREGGRLKDQLANLNSRLESLVEENKIVKSEIDYFNIRGNIEKELRARFNYKRPEEKMMIIVP